MKITSRPRRNRRTPALREMISETQLEPRHLILPLFVCEGKNKSEPILSLPGQSRLSIDEILKCIQRASDLGIRAVAPFPVIELAKKDPHAREALHSDGLYAKTLRTIKQQFPNIILFSDVAMDPYSSDGHDGIFEDGEILNDPTLEILAEMAIVQAQAGADYISPSDMMDGRVGFIRRKLDEAGFSHVGIMSYAAKYASAFYGPFRDALDSAPKSGDKKSYQMDPANAREALREVQLDIAEGADIILIKPALAYLDIIHSVRAKTHLPIAAYNVSGEYAMVKAAAQNKWLDEKKVVLEVLLSIRRAGADLILSYHALECAQWLKKG